MTPELSRPVPLDTIGQERVLTIDASPAERVALAARFDLRALDSLHAEVRLTPRAGGIELSGRIEARVVQPCVVTGSDVPGSVAEEVALRFVDPDLLAAADEEERELGSGDLDVLAHDRASIDVGEAVAQTLGLALDPFPRAEDAEGEVGRWSAGPDASPFAGLKGLLG